MLSGKTFSSGAGIGAERDDAERRAAERDAGHGAGGDRRGLPRRHGDGGRRRGPGGGEHQERREHLRRHGHAVRRGGLPKTGQTTAYGTGSDGDLQKGAARSFTDNGDGTITDNLTGLMWEKKSDDGSIHDKDNTYTWGLTSSPYTMNGTMVTTFLAALNGGGGFAGHTDWRIPNSNELESIVNLQNVNPAVDSAFNTSCAASCTVTACSCTQSDYYWSSTTYQADPTDAWFVYFSDGSVDDGSKSNSRYVRAVRGGS